MDKAEASLQCVSIGHHCPAVSASSLTYSHSAVILLLFIIIIINKEGL